MSTQQIKKIRAPKGFTFKIVKTLGDSCCNCATCLSKRRGKPKNVIRSVKIELSLKDQPKGIGSVYLVRYDSKSFETHSGLDKKYHGKGYGALMYARAIQWCLENGYKVRSSGSHSYMAHRVWSGNTLRRYFNIRYSESRFMFYAWNKSR